MYFLRDSQNPCPSSLGLLLKERICSDGEPPPPPPPKKKKKKKLSDTVSTIKVKNKYGDFF